MKEKKEKKEKKIFNVTFMKNTIRLIYKYINDYLSFEGVSTVGNRLGLHSCYLCSINDYPPIWELYFDKYFSENEEIAIKDFHLYLRCFIDNKKAKELIDISKDLKDYPDYLQVFKNEFLKIKDLDFINKLKQSESILEILHEENSYNNINIDIPIQVLILPQHSSSNSLCLSRLLISSGVITITLYGIF